MAAQKDDETARWIHECDIPAALISYTYRATQRRFARDLAPYEIGWGHFALLMILYADEGMSQDGLALSRGFDKTMIAKSVAKLEADGLVYRTTDPADRRVRRLYLTEAGRALCPEIEKIGLEINRLLIRDRGAADPKTALALLRQVALNASEM